VLFFGTLRSNDFKYYLFSFDVYYVNKIMCGLVLSRYGTIRTCLRAGMGRAYLLSVCCCTGTMLRTVGTHSIESTGTLLSSSSTESDFLSLYSLDVGYVSRDTYVP
jgi:hypothetical protein